jgi:uncharacterized protein (DUF58 family)
MSVSARPAEALLRRLEWTVLRRLDGLMHGDYRTLFRGPGLDLAELREYQAGDEARHIDWNVTARMQTPHVRQFLEDREASAWFILDLSASVDFGSADTPKRSLSVEFVTLLSRLLTRHGNRVGALLYTDRIEAVLPPKGGRQQVLILAERMLGPVQRRAGSQTDLGALLRATAQIIRRRSMVFVVSDFISRPGWEAPLADLARRHEVLAIRLCDPAEQALPDLGLVTLQDAETGEQLFVDTRNRRLRERFAKAARQREQRLRALFAQAGVDVLELGTAGDVGEALVRFAQLRRHLSRHAAAGALPAHLR